MSNPWQDDIAEGLSELEERIEALESILLDYFKVMWEKKRVPNVGEVKRWIKQLED